MQRFLGLVAAPRHCTDAPHSDTDEIDVPLILLDDNGCGGEREFVRSAVAEFEVEALNTRRQRWNGHVRDEISWFETVSRSGVSPGST